MCSDVGIVSCFLHVLFVLDGFKTPIKVFILTNVLVISVMDVDVTLGPTELWKMHELRETLVEI